MYLLLTVQLPREVVGVVLTVQLYSGALEFWLYEAGPVKNWQKSPTVVAAIEISDQEIWNQF